MKTLAVVVFFTLSLGFVGEMDYQEATAAHHG
jgi:hypothetical protein